MAEFAVGQIVGIPCLVQPGAFGGEYLITIEFGDETISGFAQDEYLKLQQEGRGLVRAAIVSIEGERITVQIPGSFFTRAAGRTALPAAWAASNFQLTAT